MVHRPTPAFRLRRCRQASGRIAEYQPEPQRNVTAIVLDLVNTAAPDQNRARAQLLRHLKALPANTPVGLFRFADGEPTKMLAPFTNQIDLVRIRVSDLRDSVTLFVVRFSLFVTVFHQASHRREPREC